MKTNSHAQFESRRAYCASSAICFNFAKDKAGRDVLSIDFAQSTGPKTYDWPNKIIFQFTQAELAELCAYLFYPKGQYRWIHSSAHGKKMVSVKLQQDKILFTLKTKDISIHVPVIPRDQYFLRNFALSLLIRVQPAIGEHSHFISLKQLADTMAA